MQPAQQYLLAGALEVMAMNVLTPLETAALRHAEQADRGDAQVWRWYAQAVDEGRLACQYQRGFWHIVLDGLSQANDRSFDHAIRLVHVIDGNPLKEEPRCPGGG